MSERAPKEQLEIVTKLAQDGSERHYVPDQEGKLGQRISEDYYHDLAEDYDVVNNFYDKDGAPVQNESNTEGTPTTDSAEKRDWEANPITDEERENGKASRKSQVVEDGREKGFGDFFKAGIEADEAPAKKSAFEKRVSPLNDAAELRIYGSRGRTYTHPKTGEVIADGTRQIPSARERIMSDDKNALFAGVPHKDREAFADAYENSINELLADGFELTQAEYLTAMRMQDLKNINGINAREQMQVANFVQEGMPLEEAQEKAKHLFDKVRNAQMSDAERLELARDNGYMTMGEFMKALEGDEGNPEGPDPTPEGGKDEPTTIEKMEAVEFTDDQKSAMETADKAAKEAREAYEDIKIRREGRAFNFKKGFRSKDMQAAYDKWMEAEQHAGAVVASAFAAHGFNMNTEVRGGNPDRELMKTLKALGALTTIDAHTESIKAKIEKTNDSMNKVTKKIAELYANFGAVKPGQNPEEMSRKEMLGIFTKRVVKMAGIVAVGAGTTLALSPLLAGLYGVGAAGAVAGFGVSRVARGGLLAKIKKVENNRLGSIRADEDRLKAREAIEANMGADKLIDVNLQSGTDVFKKNSEKTVGKNKKRLIGGVVLGAAGGALVEGYADDAWKGIKSGSGKVGDTVEKAWNGFGDWFDNNSPSEVTESNSDNGGVADTPQGGDTEGETLNPGPGEAPDEQPEIIEEEQVNPGPGETPVVEPTTNEDLSQYKYPFNWAAEQFGEANAMAELHRLSDIAAQNGYNVEWHNVADGNGMNDWLEIDGDSNTEHVLSILSKYKS